VIGARLRLGSLWLSQVTRVVGDWCVRLTAFLALHSAGEKSAWYSSTAVGIAPFIALAPLNGCLSNGLSRRLVMSIATLSSVLVVTGFAAAGGDWLPCLAVVALGTAVYSPSRYAVLPAVATDTHVPLSRVNGAIEMGGAAAIVGGVALGFYLGSGGDTSRSMSFESPAVRWSLALFGVCFFSGLAVRFASDVLRPESPRRAIAGFFIDCRRIFREPRARVPVLGLASFQALVTAGFSPLISPLLTGSHEDLTTKLPEVFLCVGVGAAIGCLAAGVQGHPRRIVGLVPFGITGLLIVLLILIGVDVHREVPVISCGLLGFMGGIINVPLRAAYIGAVPADARGNGMAVMNFTIYTLTTLLAVAMAGMIATGFLATTAGQVAFLALLTGVGAILAWRQYASEALENVFEVVLWPMYRIRAHGPGAECIPRTGPVLIVANHSSYFDPFWVGKIVPRHIRPMMTSVFYDLRGLRWIMRDFVRAIRVPAVTYRKEAPELKEAVAALRNNECVVIFPEGALRRTEEVPLRRFGQGVWHILKDVPDTLVVMCWIEGGWRSWASYYKGTPLENKRPDFWRHIDVAVAEPITIPPEMLDHHLTTRRYLMERCAACRKHLGLDVPALDNVGKDNHAAE
jgi:1-acyl-sn-glycerol-3-phosphate acyltransferase